MREHDCNQYLGLSEKDAKSKAVKNGYETRIISRDGTGFAVTCDCNFYRINFEIEKGKVINADVG